jgi:predicted P-loop ATPase
VKAFPRPSILVGTTNFDEFLADPTGNRRFWVVPVKTDFIALDLLAEERDRIWAAATHAFMQGETWVLSAEMKQAAKEANLDYQLSDPWENPVLNYLEGKDRVRADEILSYALDLEIERQDRASQMRVTNLLKANGWTTSREVVQGRRQRFWYSPSFNKLGCPGCSEDSESQAAVAGQPSGQPTDQADQVLNKKPLPR